jgi:hypothetical protein
MDFQKLKNLIKENKLEEALLNASDFLKNSSKSKELTLISARFSSLKSQFRSGTIEHSQANLTKNQITSSLLDIIDEVELNPKIINDSCPSILALRRRKKKKTIVILALLFLISSFTYLIHHISSSKSKVGELYLISTWDLPFKYQGEIINKKANGRGIAFFENGDYYEGEFTDNKMDGFGIYKWKDGNIFKGELDDEKMNGQGTMIYPNGDRYEGSFIDHTQSGFGTYYLNNGKRYVGTFVRGVLHGFGTIYDRESTVLYEGIFIEGEKKE